jgi:hypothetical protein
MLGAWWKGAEEDNREAGNVGLRGLATPGAPSPKLLVAKQVPVGSSWPGA